MVRDPQAEAGVPACAIEHEHDLFGGAGSRLTRKFCQLDFKERDADRGGQMEEGAARGGMDKADKIAPSKAVLHGGDRTLADRRPDPAQQRLQADTMLVGRPQLDLRVGKGGGDCLQQRPQFFLKASCCSASASAWRGRGTCRLCLRRCR